MILKKLLGSSFIKDSSSLFIINIIIQILNFISFIALARIYNTDSFGKLALVISTSTILATIFSLNYELVIVKASEKEKFKIMKIFFIVYVIISSIISVILVLFQNLVVLILLQALLIANFNIYINFFTSLKNFKMIFFLKLSNILLFFILSFLFYNFFIINNKLVIAYILSYLLVNIIAITSKFKSLYQVRISFKDLKFIFFKYKNFPFFSLPQKLLNNFSNQLPIYFLSIYFGNHYAGLFLMLNKLLFTLPSIISSSISLIFYYRFSESIKKSDYTSAINLFRSIYRILIFLSPLLILLIILGIFFLEKYILSDTWNGISKYSLFLAPMVILRFIGSIISPIVLVLDYQKKAFLIEIIHTFLRFIALLVSSLVNNFTLFLISFSLVSLLVTLYRLYWYNILIKGVKRMK